jgi:CDP-diacylglycerol---glycerol-3-phosphate 3-phosphatidyltransferase
MLKGTIIETRYYGFLDRNIVPWLVRWRLKPDHVSILGLLAGALAGLCFAYSPFWGGFFTLLAGLLDTLDGTLARALEESRKFGAFLDSVLDRYAELIIFLGIWCYFYRHDAKLAFASLTILFILFGSLMVSYTRARAEGLGERCMVGMFQRGERIILLGLAGMVNPFANWAANEGGGQWTTDFLLVATLLIMAIGTNITAIKRFLHVLNNLRR